MRSACKLSSSFVGFRCIQRNAHCLEGRSLAKKILNQVKEGTEYLYSVAKVKPRLVIMSSGADGASQSYINQKLKQGAFVGMDVEHIDIQLKDKNNIKPLEDEVRRQADRPETTGIIIQLPVLDQEGTPIAHAQRKSMDYLRKNNMLVKDVDGMHPCSEVLFRYRDMSPTPYNLSCTPLAVLKLVKFYDINITHKHAVIVGRSSIVGLPLINGFLEEHYQMTITSPHISDPDLSRHTKQADLIIVAAGSPSLITPDMIKEGAILIDIGINRVASKTSKSGYRIVGDIDEKCYEKAGAYTPVPGGIGPMTVSLLLQNTLRSALYQHNVTLPNYIQLY